MRPVVFGHRSTQRPAARASGFTLVELLVVVGIIAVLIGILMPVLSKARAAANRAVCLSNIRQLSVGIFMYCNDNKGWFPTCAAPADGIAHVHYPDDWIWWEANRNLDDSAIAKYVGRGEQLKQLLRCPADTFDGRKTSPAIGPLQGPYLYSYAMNANLAANFKPYGRWYAERKISQWRAPFKKILLTEGLETIILGPCLDYDTPLTRRHGRSRFHGDVPGNPPLRYGAMNGCNVSTVFLDGHAEGIDQDFIHDPAQIKNRPEAQ